MLVTWPNFDDLSHISFGNRYNDYNIIVARDRMKNQLLGAIKFDRKTKTIESLEIVDTKNQTKIQQVLEQCARNQLNQTGGSFHYRYPEYVMQSDSKYCPCCNYEPMPDNQIEIKELDYAWIIASALAQGCLFGKSCVVSKKHFVNLFDMNDDDLMHFMMDVKRAAKALNAVTGAIKINYEIHCNSGPHLHCHLFPRYLDDMFPSAPIDYRIVEPSPYESKKEFDWFIDRYRNELSKEEKE